MRGDGCFGILVQGKADTACLEIVNGQVGAQEAVTEDVKVVVPCLDTYDAIVDILLVEIYSVVFKGHTEIVAGTAKLNANLVDFPSHLSALLAHKEAEFGVKLASETIGKVSLRVYFHELGELYRRYRYQGCP
jgi:hypothetical protein